MGSDVVPAYRKHHVEPTASHKASCSLSERKQSVRCKILLVLTMSSYQPLSRACYVDFASPVPCCIYVCVLVNIYALFEAIVPVPNVLDVVKHTASLLPKREFIPMYWK